MPAFRNRVSYDLRLYFECFPHIERYRRLKILEMMSKSVINDSMFPHELDKHDEMFEPRNEYEKLFWNSFREMAKQDMKTLVNSIENGKKGGRPPMTAEEKKAKLEQAAKNSGAAGKNQVKLTPDFKLPNNEYFNAYRKELPKETKSVERWLKTAKLDSVVDYDWIGKQIQNFRKRKTGRIL